MQSWEDLWATALLGTERRKPKMDAPELEPIRQIDTSDTDHWLLTSGALLATYRRAGYQPLSQSEAPLAANPEWQPVCSAKSAAYLSQMLESPGKYEETLTEWLTIIARKGKRVPHDILVRLLNWGQQRTRKRELITAVVGERGRWLAEQNTDWQYAASAPTADIFNHTEAPIELVTEKELLAQIKSENSLLADKTTEMVRNYRQTWNARIVDALADKLIADLASSTIYAYAARGMAPLLHQIPFAWLGLLIRRLQTTDATNKENVAVTVTAFLEILEYRYAMLQELDHE